MTPPRPPRRIVHEHAVGVGADRDDVVVASGPIFEEQNDRRARGQLFAEKIDGSVERRRPPVPLPHRLDEDVIGDAARAAIDERLELLHVGVAIAVVPEYHGDRRAAAQRGRLRKKGNVQRQRDEERRERGHAVDNLSPPRR